MKRNDIKTAISDLAELFKMIEYKANTDEYICSMKQYIVNPLAYLHAKEIQQIVKQSEPESNPCKQCSGTGIVEVLSLGKACRQVVCKCQINAMKGERG